MVGGRTGMEKGVEMALVGDQWEGQYLRTKALSNVANNVIMTNTFIPEWCATRLSGMELMPTQSTPSPANIFSSETDGIYLVLASSWHSWLFREPPLYQIHNLTKRKPPASNQHGSLVSDYQITRFRYLRHFRSLVHRWWWGHPPSMCPLYPPGIRDSDLRGFLTLKMPFWLPLVFGESSLNSDLHTW